MTTKEKQEIAKIPAKKIREMYVALVDEIRNPNNTHLYKRLYNVGWHDGAKAKYNDGTL